MKRYLTIQFLKFFCCAVAALISISSCVFAQETLVKDQFNAYNQKVLQEKLYVHTDKNAYLAGEICWFKIYNTDAFFNKPLGLSKVAYVEVLDKNNKPVLQSKVGMNTGDGNGSLQFPISLASGRYKLRAYTNWMKNFSAVYFFEKQITVINARKIYANTDVQVKNRYDVQFFPEGGNLVNGLQSKIAFKVTDQNGKGIACKGVVIDNKADTVAKYTTLKFGMGSFMFKPAEGKTYKAITIISDSVHILQDLPVAFGKGYVMHVDDIVNRQVKISVQSADDKSTDPVFLFAHTRGSVKAVLSYTLHDGYTEFLVDTAKLGDGITHFTIFDAARRPVAERLFFKQPSHQFTITAATTKVEYDLRQKINISINTADKTGKPLPANMSMAVYRIDSLTLQDEMDISNYLWLSSDLAGNIESPGYYFNNPSSETTEALNNLLLTQGWRRFRWEDILQNKQPAFKFIPEYKAHIIQGRVTNSLTGKPEKNAECFLSVAGTRTQFKGDLSDDSGFVKFEMANFYGNNEIIIQPSQLDSSKHIEVLNPYADNFSSTPLQAFALPERNPSTLYSQNVAVQVQNNYRGDKLQLQSLPTVDTFPFYIKPDASYKLDDYVRFTTIEEVLREYVPDVNVRRKDGKYYFPVFDNVRKEFFTVDPLVLLDGVPVFDNNKLMAYDPLKIKRLEVVARMYFYGKMYFGGIVNFITYKGDLTGFELDPHTTVMDYETLQMQREFFSPVYETEDQFAARLPDFRTLLYWSPSVNTNNNGQQQVEFYTSDLPGHFAAVLQGITADGQTGAGTIFFDVKENYSLQVKK